MPPPQNSEGSGSAHLQMQAPVDLLVKFIERLYRRLPQFVNLALSQEFIEALAASLFPPTTLAPVDRDKNRESKMKEFDDEDVRTYLFMS